MGFPFELMFFGIVIFGVVVFLVIGGVVLTVIAKAISRSRNIGPGSSYGQRNFNVDTSTDIEPPVVIMDDGVDTTPPWFGADDPGYVPPDTGGMGQPADNSGASGFSGSDMSAASSAGWDAGSAAGASIGSDMSSSFGGMDSGMSGGGDAGSSGS